jgi:hypothetical protein
LFAAPHGLSQRTTSFIACACQGIHRTPLRHLIALIINARSRDQRTEIRGQIGLRRTAPPPRLPLRPDGIAAPCLQRHGTRIPSPSRQRVRPAPHAKAPEQVLKDQCHTRTFRRPRRSSFSQLSLIPGPLKGRNVRKILLFTMSANRQRARQTEPPQIHSLRQDGPADVRTQMSENRISVLCHPFSVLRAQRALVEPDGIEPTTSCLQSRRSPN